MIWNLQTIGVAAALAVAILTIIGKVFGFFGWVKSILSRSKRISSASIDVPNKTIILVPIARPNALWWHMGSMGDKPAMQIVGDLNVTNISAHGVFLMGARLRKPKAIGHVVVRASDSNLYSSNHVIPRGSVSDLRFDFFVQPPTRKNGEVFKADVAIVDQFGNEHWLKKVEFPCM